MNYAMSPSTAREMGMRLRATRMRRGVHHRTAAALAGLPERYYVECEAGLALRWADLSVPQMWRLCDAVGLHPATLFLGL